jgi:uncharacterized protein
MSDAVAPAATSDFASPAPVTTSERIAAIDVVRGLAMLGILVMNVVEFGHPFGAYENPAHSGGATGASLIFWYVQAALFDGKMRALFSMLFGAGMLLIAERMQRKGQGAAAADILLRRCLWLVLFGIVHRFLLQWTGDILYQYGLLGLIMVPFRHLRARTLLIAGIAALTMPVFVGLKHYRDNLDTRAKAELAVQLEKQGEALKPDLVQARDTVHSWAEATPTAERLEREFAQARGSYTQVFANRWNYHHSFQSAYLYYFFVWDVLGMMLVGMGLMKAGFFAGTMSTRAYALFIIAGALAAGGAYAVADAWAQGGFVSTNLELHLLKDSTYTYQRGLVALGWAAVLILLVRAGAARWLTAPLAAVGRMAFSCYILQTLCCTLFFFGYGLGYYGKLERAQLLYVVAAVSALQIAFSMWWLRAFRFGPLEWCWRSLTYWRRQPMRRELGA